MDYRKSIADQDPRSRVRDEQSILRPPPTIAPYLTTCAIGSDLEPRSSAHTLAQSHRQPEQQQSTQLRAPFRDSIIVHNERALRQRQREDSRQKSIYDHGQQRTDRHKHHQITTRDDPPRYNTRYDGDDRLTPKPQPRIPQDTTTKYLENCYDSSVNDKRDSASASNQQASSSGDVLSAQDVFRTKYDQTMAANQTRIETLPPMERQTQEAWAQNQLQSITGSCIAGFAWNRIKGGYRCQGSNHMVTDELLAEGRGGFWLSCPHALKGTITRDGERWYGPVYSESEAIESSAILWEVYHRRHHRTH